MVGLARIPTEMMSYLSISFRRSRPTVWKHLATSTAASADIAWQRCTRCAAGSMLLFIYYFIFYAVLLFSDPNFRSLSQNKMKRKRCLLAEADDTVVERAQRRAQMVRCCRHCTHTWRA